MGSHAKGATTQRLTIDLPVEVADVYAERSMKAGKDVTSEIERTLSRCRWHNASTPIYLNDDDRNELSQLAGRMIRTPEDVVALVRELVSVKVAGTSVALHSQLLKRLESRKHGLSMEDLVRRVTVDSLEQFVGLR